MIELRRELKRSSFETKGKVTERTIDLRQDPLTGLTSRIIEKDVNIGPKGDFSEIIEQPQCPFCEARLETQTPKAAPSGGLADRIRVGDTVLVPNLFPYADHCGVLVFKDHFTEMGKFRVEDICNGLLACRDFFRVVQRHDKGAVHASINWNYMNPSGGTLLHPHLQALADARPTHLQRLMMEGARRYPNFWKELLEQEKKDGERIVTDIGKVHLLTPFAPIGHDEVTGILEGRYLLSEMTEGEARDLAEAIMAVQSFYHHLGRNSLNMAMMGSAATATMSDSDERRLWVTFRMVARSNLVKFYRSDASFMERIHLECVTSRAPETTAKAFREFLGVKRAK